MFTMFAGLAQFERDTISERTREGLAVAAAQGRVAGRPETSDSKVEYALHLYDKGGMTTQQIADEVGISRMTLHRKLKAREHQPAGER